MGGNKNWQGALDGAAQAAQHANDVRADWRFLAMAFFISLARQKKALGETFLTEDVVEYAENDSSPLFAPDNRAWGSVAMQAKRLGVVESAGLAYSKKGGGHAAPRTVWKPL
jgi:hypothetical protein